MKQISYSQTSNPLRKLAAYVVTAALIVLALMFSLVMLAVIFVVGLLALAYVGWRTRGLRRNMRGQPLDGVAVDEAMHGAMMKDDIAAGQVIEGEAIRIVEPQTNSKGSATLVT